MAASDCLSEWVVVSLWNWDIDARIGDVCHLVLQRQQSSHQQEEKQKTKLVQRSKENTRHKELLSALCDNLQILHPLSDLCRHFGSRFPELVSPSVLQDGSGRLWIDGYGSSQLCDFSRIGLTKCSIFFQAWRREIFSSHNSKAAQINSSSYPLGTYSIGHQQGTRLSRTCQWIWSPLELLLYVSIPIFLECMCTPDSHLGAGFARFRHISICSDVWRVTGVHWKRTTNVLSH